MSQLKNVIKSSRPDNSGGGGNKCSLTIRNKSGSRLNLVLHGTEMNIVRAMTVRRYKKLKLIKGTYVMEAWLSTGRIGIQSQNIPHISIEKITSRKDVSIRGRKIVADFINDQARLDFEREPTDGEAIKKV